MQEFCAREKRTSATIYGERTIGMDTMGAAMGKYRGTLLLYSLDYKGVSGSQCLSPLLKIMRQQKRKDVGREIDVRGKAGTVATSCSMRTSEWLD